MTPTHEGWDDTDAIIVESFPEANAKHLLKLLDDVWEARRSDPKNCISALVLEDCMSSRGASGLFSPVVQELVARAHRHDILLIVGVHNAFQIYGGSTDLFDIKMQCGVASSYEKAVQDFWKQFCVKDWPEWQNFLATYSAHILDRGQYLVSHRSPNISVGDGLDYYYWRPTLLTQPIAIRTDLMDLSIVSRLQKWCSGIEYKQLKTTKALPNVRARVVAFEQLFVSWGIPSPSAQLYATRLVESEVAIEDLNLITESELYTKIGVTLLGHLLKFRRFHQESLPITLTVCGSN